MNLLMLLFLVFFAPFFLFLGWLSISAIRRSRLGSYFPRVSVRPGLDAYDRHYLRTMVNTGSSMSEQIELDNMLVQSDHEE